MLIGTAVAVLLFIAQEVKIIPISFVIPGSDGASAQSFMAANFWRAVWAWLISSITAIGISFFTKNKTDEELHGFVKGLIDKDEPSVKEIIPFNKKPEFWAAITLVIFIIINILLW